MSNQCKAEAAQCYEHFICSQLPLSQVIGPDEQVILRFAPDPEIVPRVLANEARFYRIFFLILFVIVEISFFLFCIPFLSQPVVLLFLLILFCVFSCAEVYLITSILKNKASKYTSITSSEYILSEKKLYLKMTPISFSKQNRSLPCRLIIIDLAAIRSVKFYRSIWDRYYKQTGSFRIKAIAPYSSITLHNIPHTTPLMTLLTTAIKSVQKT